MGKIAFVFSGQGDQHSGMGKNLSETYSVAKEIFRMCDELRPGTSKQCFEGSEEELKETKNTQPCLFAMELAAASVLMDKGIKADAVAGFSLGEVVAATFSGIFTNEAGFELVCKRGQLMQQAAEAQDTSMAAVVKLEEHQVVEICKKHPQVYPVNFNCPGQISVAGLKNSMPEFSADIKAAGGRALPLKVKGAFHSPFMDEAAERFRQELENVEVKQQMISLYSNLTGEIYPEDVRETLSAQINHPVRWEIIIRNMIADGIDTFIEIGPGTTLTNMIKKIDKGVTAYSYKQEVEGC